MVADVGRQRISQSRAIGGNSMLQYRQEEDAPPEAAHRRPYHTSTETAQEPEVILQNAAETRVTPQELAEAVAAIESKRAAEEQRQTETITLGEAVQQLSLPVTPE